MKIDLNKQIQLLESMRKETLDQYNDLQKLESDNRTVESKGYEDHIEILEKQFRDTESARKDI